MPGVYFHYGKTLAFCASPRQYLESALAIAWNYGLETALMSFFAEGLGVTLAREHIKKLPHPGVTFRPLAPALKND